MASCRFLLLVALVVVAQASLAAAAPQRWFSYSSGFDRDDRFDNDRFDNDAFDRDDGFGNRGFSSNVYNRGFNGNSGYYNRGFNTNAGFNNRGFGGYNQNGGFYNQGFQSFNRGFDRDDSFESDGYDFDLD